MSFANFAHKIATQFAHMSKIMLATVKLEHGDEAWNFYLNAYPEGTNNIYRTRREHDCGTCRNFIRNVGHVVAIELNGNVITIWDVTDLPEPYATVAKAMSKFIRSKLVDTLFYTKERSFGQNTTFEQLTDGNVQRWNHFAISIPAQYVSRNAVSEMGNARSRRDVFLRGMQELTLNAGETVLDLIKANQLYRGSEFKRAVATFIDNKRAFDALPADRRDAWCLQQSAKDHPIRNTAIGTLLQDLSEGVDEEVAVRLYEGKVAPQNYRRPQALVTERMLEAARKELIDGNLLPSLHRRIMSVRDMQNVFFTGQPKPRMEEELEILDIASTAMSMDQKKIKAIDIAAQKFRDEILPSQSLVEIFFGNNLGNNLVTLTEATDPLARPLFKWGNNFGWDYIGGFADAIAERVKKAGGKIDGDVCIRLAWNNYDDLDLHITHNESWQVVNFRSRRAMGGELDVDMNAGGGTTREPVENIVFQDITKMPDGNFVVRVNNYARRESKNYTFQVDVVIGERRYSVTCNNPNTSQNADVFVITKKGNSLEVTPHDNAPKNAAFSEGAQLLSSELKWGLETNKWHNVLRISQSFDGAHMFFIPENCHRDAGDEVRAFHNEYVDANLNQHRKALELIGGKIKVAPAIGQEASGFGFTAARNQSVLIRTTNQGRKAVYNVKF